MGCKNELVEWFGAWKKLGFALLGDAMVGNAAH